MKNPEMLKFVPDHLRPKMMGKQAVEKLCFLIRYVLDWYKTQWMCDKATPGNGGMLVSVPNW